MNKQVREQEPRVKKAIELVKEQGTLGCLINGVCVCVCWGGEWGVGDAY